MRCVPKNPKQTTKDPTNVTSDLGTWLGLVLVTSLEKRVTTNMMGLIHEFKLHTSYVVVSLPLMSLM